MTGTDIVRRARLRISDTTNSFTDAEMIDYVNDAIDFLNTFLIANKDTEFIVSFNTSDGMPVPLDFHSLAGVWPVTIENGLFRLKVATPPTQKLAYYAVSPHIVLLTDAVKFKDIYQSALSQLTAIYAANRNGANLAQDKTLFDDAMASIKAARA